jgi:hypothetical protein
VEGNQEFSSTSRADGLAHRVLVEKLEELQKTRERVWRQALATTDAAA